MKKTWNNPELEQLEIAETAGGSIYDTNQDGPVWQDNNGVWQTPSGHNPLSE